MELSPPVPPRRPTVLVAHGDERVDEFYWLRNRDDPEVVAHLEAENAYTEAATAHLAPLRERLFDEIRSRVQETDLSVPVRKGPYRYYARTVEGRQYPLHCRRPADAPEPEDPLEPTPEEEVLLDENALAAGHAYFSLGALAVSPDHRLLAYAVDTSGDERHVLRIRDLEQGTDLPEVIEDTSVGLAWAADSATLFYTRPDPAMRPYQLYRHRVGTDPATDVCVFTEPDEHFYLGVGTTKDERYVVVELESKTTTEAHVLDAKDPEGELRVIEPRRHGIEYAVEHHGASFLVVTNDGAENFRLVAAPEEAPGAEHWEEVLPYDPDVRLLGIEVFATHLALYERAGGLRRIRVAELPRPDPRAPGQRGGVTGGLPRLDPAAPQPIETEEALGTAYGGPNPEFHATTLRYEYTSLVTPRSVYDFDLVARTSRLRKRQPVRGGYDPAAYATERAFATAKDGEAVPISIVRRKDTPLDGSAPAVLYGYGAYEHSIDPAFSIPRLSLLDRGFVFAVAHVRGGGELGRRWYEGGRLLHKRATFDDFVACARHLVEAGYTSTDRLVARGASAGGLLMGVVANEAPELFRGIVAEVPFVDCLTTILDESLPLTVTEWEEWGNPKEDPEAYAYLRSYAPYDNVGPHPYPRMLVTAGFNDPRVGYFEPAKWVAKLRTVSPGTDVLLKVEMGAGHAGPSGRYDAWRDEAFVLAWILDTVGIRA
jgi:oligopeptidase B